MYTYSDFVDQSISYILTGCGVNMPPIEKFYFLCLLLNVNIIKPSNFAQCFKVTGFQHLFMATSCVLSTESQSVRPSLV